MYTLKVFLFNNPLKEVCESSGLFGSPGEDGREQSHDSAVVSTEVSRQVTVWLSWAVAGGQGRRSEIKTRSGSWCNMY